MGVTFFPGVAPRKLCCEGGPVGRSLAPISQVSEVDMKAFATVLAALLFFSSTSFGQTSPAASTPSTDAAAVGAGAVPAVPAAAPRPAPLSPGAKVFVDPMGGFGQLLADSIVHKKVPVVVVKQPAEADFVMSGSAWVRNRNFVTGFVLSSKGGLNISMKDARGNLVFACNFHRVDSNERDGDIYLGWADQCAGHLKKALKKK